jgi:hypothetical protein
MTEEDKQLAHLYKNLRSIEEDPNLELNIYFENENDYVVIEDNTLKKLNIKNAIRDIILNNLNKYVSSLKP